MVLHNNFSDFVLFLFVHMSHVDNDYHPTEMKVIEEKMVRLFPKGTDLEKKLYNAIREYNGFDKSQIEPMIRNSFLHFGEVKSTQKYKVYSDIYDIINADGKIEASETAAMDVLGQIMEIGKETQKAL